MILNDWQRIEKIVHWTGLSVNSFALNIGLNRGENLYQIKKGNNGISKELAELITKKYPEISKAWLLTGEGEMFVCDPVGQVAIPCFETDMTYVVSRQTPPPPSYMVTCPRFDGADFAALSLGRAMLPEIPAGALVVLQRVEPEEVIPGYTYLIVSRHFTGLRRIKKEPESDTMRLVAANPEFDDLVIDICEITQLFHVRGHIHYNQ